jgi:hypothetical protein
MKINGQKLNRPNSELIFLPRGDGNDIVFKAQAVPSDEEFTKLFPEPKVPNALVPGGTKPDFEHPKYKELVEKRGSARFDWIVLKSLEATEGLEWETVDLKNPDTYGNYRKELMDSGINSIEIGRIIKGVLVANSLSEDKIEEARKRFLAGQAKVLES